MEGTKILKENKIMKRAMSHGTLSSMESVFIMFQLRGIYILAHLVDHSPPGVLLISLPYASGISSSPYFVAKQPVSSRPR